MISTAFSPLSMDAASITVPPVQASVFTLDNGLTLIVEEDRSAPVVSVQAWVQTGSVHEGEWMGAGLSHILEHMLFKGTQSRGAGDIARQVQDEGGYINAYTSFDRTVYWIDAPSSGTAAALDILSDAMMNSTLPEDEYVKEQEVIRREFAMGFDDPNRQSIQLLLRTIYTESPWRHPIIGYLDVYNQLTRDDVMAYYRERYAPNNITFVVAGDVDAQAVKAQLEKFFADHPRRPITPVFLPSEPEQLGRREAHEEFATDLSRLNLAWQVPGLEHPDAAALEVLGNILGSGRSSVLNREIREKQRLAHAISAGLYSLPGKALFYVSAMTDPDKRQSVEDAVMATLAKSKKEGFSEAEVAKARRSLLADHINSFSTARGKASGLGSDWFTTRNLEFGSQFVAQLDSVTPEDVKRVAERYLIPDKLTVTSLNPLGTLAVASEAPATSAQRGEIQKFELKNGLRLLVCEDPRLPLVTVLSTFRGGLMTESSANNGITKLLSRSMLKGTKSRTAEQLAEQIESLGGSLSSDSGNNSFSLGVDVLAPDLAAGMELLADILAQPSFPEEEVNLEKSSQIAAIKSEEDQITSVARNLLREQLFESHPYALRNAGQIESVESLTPEALRALHSELVVGSNGVLAVFGDVKADEVVKLAEKYFAALPSGQRALAELPQPGNLEQRKKATTERDKQQAVVMVGYRGVDVASEDRPILELIDQASSDLGSRFFNRIREEMGLAYFVGSSQMLGLAPGLFVFYAGTDPAKVDDVMTALNEEIQTLAKDGLTEEELKRAKKKLIGSESIANQSNRGFAANSAVSELVGLGYDHFARRAAEIENVTVEDTRRVARKYFGDQHPVEVVVRPPLAETAANSQN